jgi:hypothetical protein
MLNNCSRVPIENCLKATIFHDHWWLDAATNGQFGEVTVEGGGGIAGRFPFVLEKRRGLTECKMPPFTHVLGPVVDSGSGKPQSRLIKRLSLVRELIDRLPPFDLFTQTLDCELIDGLAFQDQGFEVKPQYTFVIDCTQGEETLWNGLHFKTRQHIRRAREKFSIGEIEDPYEFIDFYTRNIRTRGVKNYIDFSAFPQVFWRSRNLASSEILCARWENGAPAAMAFLVWGYGTMYYTLSTRSGDTGDNGSISLLIWSAIKRAESLGLKFDLDGVSSNGTARFYSGFNGTPKARLVVRRRGALHGLLQDIKRWALGRPHPWHD